MKNKTNLLFFVLSLMLLLLNTSCYSIIFGDREFSMKKGVLYRGKETYILQCFYAPDTARQGAELKTMVPLLASIGEVGGNSVAMDLLRDPNSTSVEAQDLETIKTYANRAKDQYMTVILRIAPNSQPNKKNPLLNTLKQNFKGLLTIVYWTDGPYADEWTKAMKKINKYWVIISKQNADLIITEDISQTQLPKEKVIFSASPGEQIGKVHFLLPYTKENLNCIEEAYAKYTPCTNLDTNSASSLLSEQERQEGFIPLFDGKTINGWWYLGDNHNCFAVNPEGFIEWKSKGGKALMSCERYDNFILRLEWMVEKGGNTGVWVRAPRGSRASKIGFEVQILGDSDTTALTDDTTGAIYKVVPPKVKAMKPEGQWNDLEIICNGPYVKVTLNGQVVQDINFDEIEELKYRLRKGFIGLTDHGNYCGFRNIRIKPL